MATPMSPRYAKLPLTDGGAPIFVCSRYADTPTLIALVVQHDDIVRCR